MQGFETFWQRCERALTMEGLEWPDGVTFVNFPANEGGKDYTVHKP